jgi:hypothetical protein
MIKKKVFATFIFDSTQPIQKDGKIFSGIFPVDPKGLYYKTFYRCNQCRGAVS